MKGIWMLTTAVAMSVTAAAGAQSAKAMGTPSKGDTMMMTYTGCVESVNHDGWFRLTKVDSGANAMHSDAAMTHHDDAAMKGDAARTVQNGQMPTADDKMADDKMDAMPVRSFALTGSRNLRKHVGQRVSVTGSLSDGSMASMRHETATLTVKTLKVIGKSCS